MSFGVLALSWLESFLRGRTQCVSVSGKSSDRMSLTCGVPQGYPGAHPLSHLLRLRHCHCQAAQPGCALIRRRHPTIYIHTAPAMVDNTVQRLVVCVEELHQCMNANRLRLNEDKTQFIWLGTPHQLFEVQCQQISLRGVDIQISTEVTCLSVLLDSRLTFAPYVRRLSGKCFYHLRQLKTVR